MKRFLHWTAVLVLVLFVLFWLGISLRSACHECLAAPSVAECQRSNGAVDLEIHSTRKHGYIVERHFAECTFYWHEANTGGN